jgi:hypothetical protein
VPRLLKEGRGSPPVVMARVMRCLEVVEIALEEEWRWLVGWAVERADCDQVVQALLRLVGRRKADALLKEAVGSLAGLPSDKHTDYLLTKLGLALEMPALIRVEKVREEDKFLLGRNPIHEDNEIPVELISKERLAKID